jgi:hypothetical protein
MARSAGESGDNGSMTRSVGLPVARGLLAFAEGRHDAAVTQLAPVKAIAARAGGSHAQRDLLAQTLLAAAERGGQMALARSLVNERLMLKPRSPLNLQWQARLRHTAAPTA